MNIKLNNDYTKITINTGDYYSESDVYTYTEVDNSTLVTIPDLNLRLYIFDDIDLSETVRESVKQLELNYKKYGKGIEFELNKLK